MTEAPGQQPPPLPWRWRERAVQWLDFPLGRFLDYGCGNCGLMVLVHHRCDECHGVDLPRDVLDQALRQYPEFRLRPIELDGKTDFSDDHFDTIAAIEVIEHVPDERAMLAELARILKPGGRLLLTTPHQGLLTFLDIGNVKFAFPRLHRFVHCRVLGRHSSYDQQFVPDEGLQLIGDISVAPGRKPWHRHYRAQEITAFAPESLLLKRHAVYFPAMRSLMLLRVALRMCFAGKFKPFPPPLPALERRLSRLESPRGDQLVMLFEKKMGLGPVNGPVR